MPSEVVSDAILSNMAETCCKSAIVFANYVVVNDAPWLNKMFGELESGPKTGPVVTALHIYIYKCAISVTYTFYMQLCNI